MVATSPPSSDLSLRSVEAMAFGVGENQHRCSTDRDCPSGQVCLLRNGTCHKKCTTRFDCSDPIDYGCIGGLCQRVCYNDNDCPSGKYCNGELCISDICNPTIGCVNNHICRFDHCIGGGECTTDSDCQQSNQYCSGGQCTGAGICGSDADCPGYEFCYWNACIWFL